MLPTERLKAMIAGEKVDRPGVVCWGHMPIEDRHTDDFVRETILYQERFGWEFIKMMYNGFYFTEAFGQEIRWPINYAQTPFVTKYVINDPHEWLKLKPADVKSGSFAREMEATKRVLDHFKGTVPVLPTIFSPITWAQELCAGYYRPHVIGAQIQYSPKELKAGIEVIAETNMRWAEELVKAGCDGFFYAQQLANEGYMTTEQFREFGKKYDLDFFNEFGSKTWFNMLHMHGSNLMVDELVDYPVQALNWDDRMTGEGVKVPTLREVRAKTDKILIGGIDQEHDFYETDRSKLKDFLRARVADAIDQAGAEKLIVGPGCVVPPDVPKYRMNVLCEVMEELVG